MIGLFCFVLAVLTSPFKSKLRLEAENAVLRHPLIVLRRTLHGRARLTNNDRWFLIQLYRWFPSILKVLTIIEPETLVRWHRANFRCYWRWKSRPVGGRPPIETDLRVLIRRMSVENPLWGAPRIHGKLLKLGFEVAQSSVAKYMVKRRGPPSQGWRIFCITRETTVRRGTLERASGDAKGIWARNWTNRRRPRLHLLPVRGPPTCATTTPVPVEVRQPVPGALKALQALIAPLLHPLATTGIIIIFVIFILLRPG
jgi:hypothetical protein